MDSKRLRYSLMMLIGVITFGTFGYYLVENMPLFEAFYMTIITISTVGFSEIKPLTPLGRTVTLFVIVFGISVGTYTIGILVRVFNEDKLVRAGATRVVAPYLIGGRRMAQMLKRPTVVDFIDIAMMGSHLGLMMEEAKVGPNSGLIGKNLIDSKLRKDFGVIIVAIKKMSDDMIFNPMPSETLESGDVIVVIGKKEDLKRMSSVM